MFIKLYIAMCRFLFFMTAATVFFSSCQPSSNQPAAAAPETVQPAAETPVARGAYLVGIMGCHDCHSPKRMGPQGPELIPELLLSGHPANAALPAPASGLTANGWVALSADLTTAVGPWGQTYAANITSDPTGIGNWTEDQFRKALTEGKFKGLDNARPILPPMPWQNYRNIRDEDLKAIFAYLKSTRPVSNVVPEAKIAAAPAAQSKGS